MDDILNTAHEALMVLKENVDSGKISSDLNCFYELKINNYPTPQNASISIEPLNEEKLNGTSELLFQDLYGVLNYPMKHGEDIFVEKLEQLKEHVVSCQKDQQDWTVGNVAKRGKVCE